MLRRFLLENLKVRCFFGDAGADGRMILKWVARN
jgi:hypothetical protein